MIFDNVKVAFEIAHIMKEKNGKCGLLALKLDMSKVYDRVEWDFLKEVMRTMGFSKWWISLIMKCVRSVTYSVVINVQQYGHIKPFRGIRQGDPLSLYLFLLCAEGLSSLLKKAKDENMIKGVSAARNGP